MSRVGMPSVIQTINSIPASAASIIASALQKGWHVDYGGICPKVCYCIEDIIKNRDTMVCCATFARCNTCNQFRAVFQHLLGMKTTCLSGYALAYDPCVFIY